MVIDSGATSTFVRKETNLPVKSKSNKIVRMPDGRGTAATAIVTLPYPTLTTAAREAHVLPSLNKNSLLSVPVLADEGYTTIFHPHQEGADVYKQGDVKIHAISPPVLQGCREISGLWVVDEKYEQQKQVASANNVHDLPSIPKAITFLHAAAGFPVKDTWIKAIKNGHYQTWPGLTLAAVIKHCPDAVETQKGHMKKQRQNVRSTKVKVEDESNTHTPHLKKNDVYVKIFNARDTIHTDQTGNLPVTSSRGNKFIMVLVNVDGNYIDAEPVKDHTDASLIKAYTALWNRLTASKIVTPKLHVLDNEASAAFKTAIKMNCDLQLVPPDTHRRNLAERAIQTFKSHFIAILAGVDDSFPMQLWDRLIPQAVLTLNLLRRVNANPSISAYEYVNGEFDYNKMPLAPMGCAVQIYESPNNRHTWAPHSTDGWYLRTSAEHYRSHVVFVKKTRSERISDTVHFDHAHITQPTVTPTDVIVKALQDLTQAIKESHNPKGKEQMDALKKLDMLLVTPVEQAKRVTFQDDIEKTKRTADSPTFTARAPRVVDPKVDKPFLNNVSRARNQRLNENTLQQRPTRGNNLPLWMKDYVNNVFDAESGKVLKYRQLLTNPQYQVVWNTSSANEFGRLAQGIGNRVKGTDTIFFMHKHQVPRERIKDVTYVKFVCELKPNKKEIHRTRMAVGGDKINYPDDVGTPTADLLLVKTHANSVISTPKARYMTLDISNFYLNTPMKRYEYVRIKLTDIPEEVIVEYNLRDKADENGYVYVEVRKGMYGLPQAGILAQELLEERLAKHGYTQSKIIPGYWKHKNLPIDFTLVVDDFGVKYVGKENAMHLINILRQYYEIAIDWTGTKYIGLTFDWDYPNRRVHLSMPKYIDKAVERFQVEIPKKRQDSPHPHAIPAYGAKIQFAIEKDTSDEVTAVEKKFIQQVTGTLLYYARAVDPTILVALSAIASQQAKPTTNTMAKVKQLLQYCASQEDAILTYRASDMILAVHSDAGYLSEPNARSRAGGHFFLSSDVQYPPNNGAILNVAQIIKAVMSSAAEAELGGLFINAKEAVYIRNILTEMGYPQPPTPLQTDNSTAEGVVNNTVQPKRTKSMDMRFQWLRCREAQNQFRIYWRPGKTNLADYFTKHHSPAHHRNMRGEFLTRVKDLQDSRANSAKTRQSGNSDSTDGCKGVSDIVSKAVAGRSPRGTAHQRASQI
jgi:hypothetical protein